MSSLSTIEATRLRPATVRLAHVCSNAAATARCSAADSGAPARTSAARSGRRWARGRQVADRSPHGRSNRAHRSARFAAPRCPNGVHSRTAGKIPQQKPSGGGEIRTPEGLRPGGFQDRCLKPGSATPPRGESPYTASACGQRATRAVSPFSCFSPSPPHLGSRGSEPPQGTGALSASDSRTPGSSAPVRRTTTYFTRPSRRSISSRR
jgi:hypothetical protein